ncbi:MAG: Hsp70 family protein [Ardenticatenaceae bacterium]
MSNKIIGIDLGTTNSAVAIIEDGQPKLIRISGDRIIPSVVGISPQGELLVGRPAHNQWVAAPDKTIRSIKRKMGTQETVQMAGKEYTPQEISAFILRHIKEGIEADLGEKVTRAVITVPAYFNEVQRQATIEAGEIAGLTVERIINEPTAAALAHSLGKDDDIRALVYDLGGGTFDVSVIELNFGVVDVRATAGDNELGGDDFDKLLAEKLADEFEDEHGIDLQESHQAWARLLRAAEEAKIKLSSETHIVVSLEFIAQNEDGIPLHIRREIERVEFEQLINELLDSTIELLDEALEQAELDVEEIDHVLMVGGSTRIPLVRELVSKHINRDPHVEIDPDAVVALGAAVQGAIITGEEVDAILVDVTPISLGVETAWFGITGHLHDDHFDALIPRNTTIPAKTSKLFSTLFAGQESVHVKVYQGERPIASQNVLLGDFMVEKLKPNRPDGKTDVTVYFEIDVNGILDVTVEERKSGKKVSKQLKATRQRMSSAQIASSQAKVEEVTEAPAPESNMDAASVALLDRAEKALQNPELDQDLAQDIRDTMANIHKAADDGEQELVEELGDDLIDLLFEAEE